MSRNYDFSFSAKETYLLSSVRSTVCIHFERVNKIENRIKQNHLYDDYFQFTK